MKVLVYGYGNPGRQDDGLGPALVEKLEADKIPGVSVDSNYQLQIEDAETVSEHDIVIFADASVDCKEPFDYIELEPSDEISFTTHAISPGSVLALCYKIYSKTVKAYVLAIRGYSWNFGEKFSPGAENNLIKAYIFLKEKIYYLLNTSD